MIIDLLHHLTHLGLDYRLSLTWHTEKLNNGRRRLLN
jgi:hypothetical protein